MKGYPTRQQLLKLKSFKSPNCLSIYSPYLSPNSPTNPNKIEFGNLFKDVKEKLIESGLEKKEIKKMLLPVQKMIKNHEFWPTKKQSLVAFVHPDFFVFYHIDDTNFEPSVYLSKGFVLKPLEKTMNKNRSYILLSLSHNKVEIFEGDLYDIRKVHLKNFSTNMKSALNIGEYNKLRGMHEIAPSYMGKGSEAFHGHYNVKETDKIMLLEFFRLIDKKLHGILVKKNKPLILAGVNHLIPIYRKVNTYPKIFSKYIRGNLNYSDLKTIHQRAIKIVQST